MLPGVSTRILVGETSDSSWLVEFAGMLRSRSSLSMTLVYFRTRIHGPGAPVLLLRVQLLHHQLVHQPGIGLSLRQPHHLAHKERGHGLLAGAILLHLFGIGGNRLVHEFLDGAGVGNLLGLLALIDHTEVLALFKADVEELLELLGRQLALL